MMIGELISNYRKTSKKTRKEIARQIGLGTTTLYWIEKDTTRVTYRTVVKLIDWLFLPTPQMNLFPKKRREKKNDNQAGRD